MREVIGFYDSFFFWETQMENNGIILKNDSKKEFISHKQIKNKGKIDAKKTYKNS